MKRIILTVGLAAMLLSCQSEESGPLDANTNPSSVEFTEIGDGELMGSENFTASALVIENEEEWNALKNQMDVYNHYSELFTETEIDFTQFKIIAVIDELRTSAGYNITIASITESNNQLVVDVENSDGGPGSAATVMTQPFHIVKIQRSNLPVVFE
jgi:hypothetical protein